jgi:hypothetical protein
MPDEINHSEKRSAQRYGTSVQMCYRLFSSEKLPFHEGIANNCSSDGLCFQSQHAMVPGQYIHVRTGDVDSGATPYARRPAVLKSVCLAEVRWCRRDGPEAEGSFSVGVKYL